MKVYINGKFYPEKDAKVSVFDHGLLYGDGVFEGIRVYNGRVFMLEAHIDRLFRSAKAIALDMPMTKGKLASEVARACRENRAANGYIRLIVTRGAGTLGLNPFVCKHPQIIIIVATIQLYPKELYESGLRIVTVGTPRNLCEAVSPNIKSLNYLNNIMAKIEAINAGVVEAVMLNAQGTVSEATGDNIFIIRGKSLLTPPTYAGILEGITRDVVMKLARGQGFEVRESMLTRYDLYNADEVFLTGTAAEVIPVVEIDRRKIGNGKPGKVTKDLVTRFREYANSVGYPVRGG
ncbi:MAG: branched-chain-amino-acid transaminase [Verrucomicrobia bacterium]|nr:branched-chain-amino-acid transaminase [Verrucomicrobiota bacterium]